MSGRGRYFLCLQQVITRVMIAQSIITNVNKSVYVTIAPAPFVKVQWLEISPR
nr:MAG TPA: YlxR-like protein [Caudoviricetes sp.]